MNRELFQSQRRHIQYLRNLESKETDYFERWSFRLEIVLQEKKLNNLLKNYEK